MNFKFSIVFKLLLVTTWHRSNLYVSYMYYASQSVYEELSDNMELNW